MASIIPGHAIIRTLLLSEGTLNILAASSLIFAPAATLTITLKDPSTLNATACSFAQLNGILVGALAIPLLQGAPSTVEGIANRRLAYLQSAYVETAFVALLGWTWFTGSTIYNDVTVFVLGATMIGGIAARTYASVINPDVLGWIVNDKKTQ